MNKESVIRAIVDGIQTANETYERWSNGHWLDESGAENLLTVMVATAIARSALNLERGDYLRLETLFSDIRKESGATEPLGRTRDALTGNPRADLTLWRKNGKPAAVVEMKRRFDPSTCRSDLERLASLIMKYGKRQSGSLGYGVLGIFMSAANKKALNEKHQIIKAFCRSVLPDGISHAVQLVPTRQFGEEDLICGGVVITLT